MGKLSSALSVSLSAAALIAASGGAIAAPRESAVYTAVDSTQALNNAANEIRTHAFTGGYAVRSVRISGVVQRIEAASNGYDARILVTPPSGSPFIISPGHARWSGDGTMTHNSVALILNVPIPEAAGLWTFRFFEQNVSSTSSPDAVWNNVTITLDDDLAQSAESVTLTSDAGVYTEVEPNDLPWNELNSIASMAADEQITGVTTGLSITTPGSGSADSFQVRTAPASQAIYRYRLVLTTDTPSHTASLRGYGQSTPAGAGVEGLPIVGTNVVETILLQAASTITIPPRFVQWYGFGRQERVYYRVTGGAATTSSYTSTLTRDTIEPIDLPTTLTSGAFTFTRGAGNSANVEMWLYDSNFNAIPDAGYRHGTGGTNSLTRTLGAGTYYLAVTNTNMPNSQNSPADSPSRTGNIQPFPDAVLNTSTTANVVMNMDIAYPGGVINAFANKVEPYDIVWYRFVVVPPTDPAGSGSVSPNPIAVGRTAKFTVSVTPSAILPNDITTVTLDAAPITLGSLALNDSGQNGDLVAGDSIWSRDVVIPNDARGLFNLNFQVVDIQNRTASGAISLFTGDAPAEDHCTAPLQTFVNQDYFIDTTFADTDGPVGTCNLQGTIHRDIWFEFTAPQSGPYRFSTCLGTAFDTVVAVYDSVACPTGAPLVCNDNSCGNFSRADLLAAQAGHSYLIRVGGATPTASGSGILQVRSLVLAGPITNPTNGDEYSVLDLGLTWPNAQAAATGLGGNLTSIADAEENEWIRSTMLNAVPAATRFWIGMWDPNMAPNLAGANYTWVDGSPVTFTNWAPGEPNVNLGLEHFGEMIGSTGEWIDTLLLGSSLGSTNYGIVKVDTGPPACRADFNGDTFVNPDDLADFITCFFLDIQFPGFCAEADFNGDTSRDPDDLADFITTFFLAVQFGC